MKKLKLYYLVETKWNHWSWNKHILQQSNEGGAILSKVHGRLSRRRNRSVTRRKIISIMFLSFLFSSFIKVSGITSSIIAERAMLSIPNGAIFIIEPTNQVFPFGTCHMFWPFPYLPPPLHLLSHCLPLRRRRSGAVSEAGKVEATTSLEERNILHVVIDESFPVRRRSHLRRRKERGNRKCLWYQNSLSLSV